MLRIFPLFYVALLYSFSAKDKIVFFMNQFAMFCSILTIGLIVCIFSIMNGFEENVTGKIINYYGNIYIRHNNVGKNPLEQAQSFNSGFHAFTLKNENIDKIEYQKMQQTMVIINKNQYKMFVMEDSTLNVPIAIPENLNKNIKVIDSIDIYDPDSYNSLTQTARHKVYKQYTITKKDVAEAIIFLSPKEYQRLFRSKQATFAKIYLHNENLLNSTLKDIKEQLQFVDSDLEVHSWREINPQFVSALDLQKKIFFLLYAILFILLGAIIISINIAFFKEKRKDWALLKILDISSYSVERIFFYKNIISIFITCSLGSLLGYFLTIYSDSIVNYLLSLSGTTYDSDFFFGQDRIPYIFKLNDFIRINGYSSLIFLINFLILLVVFRKENVSKLFKLGGS